MGAGDAGLYGYLFGTIGGSFFTSSAFMAVQATGAMAIVIADVPAVHTDRDPARALFTLSVVTGVMMLAAGFLRRHPETRLRRRGGMDRTEPGRRGG